MNNKTICIIGAMDCEIEILTTILNNIQEIKQGILTVYQGTFLGKNIVIAKSGVGKVCGAACTQLLIDKFNPQCIINTGVAGGLKPGMKVLDIAIAEKLVQHDFDVSALGYAKGYVCNGINPNEPTYFYTDKTLNSKLKEVISEKIPELHYFEGTIASGDTFISSNDKKQEIIKLFNAIAVEMEGAAIAHTAFLNEIPFIIIRAISDLADEIVNEHYEFNEKEAAIISSKVVKAFLEKI